MVVLLVTPSSDEVSGFIRAVRVGGPSRLSLAVEMLDMLLSSSRPRLVLLFSPSSPAPLNSFFLSGFLVFWMRSETGIHLNCFMVVSGITTHLFSQLRT